MNNLALSHSRLEHLAPGADNPDYKNLQYNADGSLSMEGEEDAGGASFGDQIKLLGNSSGEAAASHSYENTRLGHSGGQQVAGGENDDYMNDFPEGLGHIYSNQEDLLLQVSKLTTFSEVRQILDLF